MPFKYMVITEDVIKAYYNVYNTLGYGFMEKVYSNAMVIELNKLGLKVIQEKTIKVYYDGEVVGEYYADLLVEDAVIVELKAVKSLTDAHQAQLLNYLKATQYEVGLLLNYGPEASFKRKIYDNERKGSMLWIEDKITPQMAADEQ